MPLNTIQINAAVKSLNEDTEMLSNVRQRIRSQVQEIVAATTTASPIPNSYVGRIEGYRFTTGKKGQDPSHRFEVYCGGGVSLHLESDGVRFSQLMREMDMGDLSPKSINGLHVMVERQSVNGKEALVPTKVVTSLGVEDKWGNIIYVGARVYAETIGVFGDVTDTVDVGENEVLVKFGDESTSYCTCSRLIVQL